MFTKLIGQLLKKM